MFADCFELARLLLRSNPTNQKCMFLQLMKAVILLLPSQHSVRRVHFDAWVAGSVIAIYFLGISLQGNCMELKSIATGRHSPFQNFPADRTNNTHSHPGSPTREAPATAEFVRSNGF